MCEYVRVKLDALWSLCDWLARSKPIVKDAERINLQQLICKSISLNKHRPIRHYLWPESPETNLIFNLLTATTYYLLQKISATTEQK